MKYIMSTYKIIPLLLCLLLGAADSTAQFFPKNAAQADSLWKANVRKSRINGVYIPKSLDEAFSELSALASPEATLKFKLGDEDEVARKLHFGVGRWIRYNWNFEQGSRLAQLLRDLGVHRVDDMSDFIIRTYHRHLNGQPLDEATLAERYARRWNDEKIKMSKDGQLLSTKKVDSKG